MKIILLLLLSCLPAFAAEHVLIWSFNPADQFIMTYRVYEQIGGVWQLRADVPAVTNTVTLPNVTTGLHVYSLSATNVFGEGPKSVPVNAIVPGLPSAVTNIIVNLRASLETAPAVDGPWKELFVVSTPIDASQQQAFCRIRQEIFK